MEATRMPGSLAVKRDFTLYRLDDFVRKYGLEVPRIVKVVEGFKGASVKETINSGEVLTLFKVQKERKILATDRDGRRLCLSRRYNVKVEVIPDKSEAEYDTLEAVSQARPRYFRVLHDISRHGLQVDDILMFTKKPSVSVCHLNCLFVNSNEKDFVDLPTNLSGKFQALEDYRVFLLDEVLKEYSLPVKVRCASQGSQGQAGKTTSSAFMTSTMENAGDVFLEQEFEEETIFAVSSDQDILLFPGATQMTVCLDLSKDDIDGSRTSEKLRHLLDAEYLDGDRFNTAGVYFKSSPVRRYPFEMLNTASFPFDKRSSGLKGDRVDARGTAVFRRKGQELNGAGCFGQKPNVPTKEQEFTNRNDGRRKQHFEEDYAPPLPVKQKTLGPFKLRMSSVKRHKNIESDHESEKHWKGTEEFDRRCLRTGFQSQSCLGPQHLEIHTEGRGTTTPVSERNSRTRPACDKKAEDTAKGKELVCFPSSSLPKPSLAKHEKRANEPKAYVDANSSEMSSTASTLETAQNNGRGTFHNLVSSETNCDTSYDCQGFPMDNKDKEWHPSGVFNAAMQAATKQPDRLPTKPQHASSFLDPSYEGEENSDCGEFQQRRTVEKCKESKSHVSDVPEKSDGDNPGQGSGVNPKDVPHKEESSPREDGVVQACPKNVENQKKGFFNTLGRKTKLLRNDASKPVRAPRKQESRTRSGEHWISSPRDDDFLDSRTIQDFLETRQKLTQALAQIRLLESQVPKGPPLSTTSENMFAVDTAEDTVGQKSVDHRWNDKKMDEKESGSSSEQRIGSQATPCQSSPKPEEIQDIEISGSERKSKDHSLSGLALPEWCTMKQFDAVLSQQDEDDIKDEADEMEDEELVGNSHWKYERSAIEKGPQFEDSCEEKLTICDEWRDKGHGGNKELYRKGGNRSGIWFCPGTDQSTDTLERYFSREAAKYELKMAILNMTWSEEEWMELTELVRMKRRKDPTKVEYQSQGNNPLVSHHAYNRTPNQTGSNQGTGSQGSHGYININQPRQQAEGDMQAFAPSEASYPASVRNPNHAESIRGTGSQGSHGYVNINQPRQQAEGDIQVFAPSEACHSASAISPNHAGSNQGTGSQGSHGYVNINQPRQQAEGDIQAFAPSEAYHPASVRNPNHAGSSQGTASQGSHGYVNINQPRQQAEDGMQAFAPSEECHPALVKNSNQTGSTATGGNHGYININQPRQQAEDDAQASVAHSMSPPSSQFRKPPMPTPRKRSSPT